VKTVRLQLKPTTRSDVLCCACGGFTTGVRSVVIVRRDGAETDYGFHATCIPEVHVKFTRASHASPEADTPDPV
jgi:hypothetical protein